MVNHNFKWELKFYSPKNNLLFHKARRNNKFPKSKSRHIFWFSGKSRIMQQMRIYVPEVNHSSSAHLSNSLLVHLDFVLWQVLGWKPGKEVQNLLLARSHHCWAVLSALAITKWFIHEALKRDLFFHLGLRETYNRAANDKCHNCLGELSFLIWQIKSGSLKQTKQAFTLLNSMNQVIAYFV